MHKQNKSMCFSLRCRAALAFRQTVEDFITHWIIIQRLGVCWHVHVCVIQASQSPGSVSRSTRCQCLVPFRGCRTSQQAEMFAESPSETVMHLEAVWAPGKRPWAQTRKGSTQNESCQPGCVGNNAKLPPAVSVLNPSLLPVDPVSTLAILGERRWSCSERVFPFSVSHWLSSTSLPPQSCPGVVVVIFLGLG